MRDEGLFELCKVTLHPINNIHMRWIACTIQWFLNSLRTDRLISIEFLILVFLKQESSLIRNNCKNELMNGMFFQMQHLLQSVIYKNIHI